MRATRKAASRVAVLAIAMAMTVGVAQAADQRLTDAQASLEKARALVAASQAGTVSDRAQREFDRHTGRAMDLIDRATAEIEAAKTASDNG